MMLIRLASVAVAILIAMLPGHAHAATSGALYAYDLTGSAQVVNAGSVSAPMNLVGDWSPSADGVYFRGDRVSKQSAAVANPASGYTLNVNSATHGIGAAIAFRYYAPEGGCFKDSVNLTQIGRFAANTTQLKLQLSKCGQGSTVVQCRAVGQLSSTGTMPQRNTLALEDQGSYVAQCFKGPDPLTGKARLYINVERVDTGVAVETSYLVPRTGTMRSSAWLSVANKYPFAVQTKNTDQFVGAVSSVAYCTGLTLIDVRVCLDAEV